MYKKNIIYTYAYKHFSTNIKRKQTTFIQIQIFLHIYLIIQLIRQKQNNYVCLVQYSKGRHAQLHFMFFDVFMFYSCAC